MPVTSIPPADINPPPVVTVNPLAIINVPDDIVELPVIAAPPADTVKPPVDVILPLFASFPTVIILPYIVNILLVLTPFPTLKLPNTVKSELIFKALFTVKLFSIITLPPLPELSPFNNNVCQLFVLSNAPTVGYVFIVPITILLLFWVPPNLAATHDVASLPVPWALTSNLKFVGNFPIPTLLPTYKLLVINTLLETYKLLFTFRSDPIDTVLPLPNPSPFISNSAQLLLLSLAPIVAKVLIVPVTILLLFWVPPNLAATHDVESLPVPWALTSNLKFVGNFPIPTLLPT